MILSQYSLEDLKIQQKKLSRKIGEAKKNGDNADAFFAEIKKISAQIKQLEAGIKKNTDEGKSETGITETNHVNPFALPCIRYASNTNDRTFDNATINEFSLLTEDSTAIESYLHKHPGSTPYHRPCVLRTIQTTFLHDCRYWVAKRESQICGVLPLVQLKSRLFGNYCVSMPFFNYGGVLADDVIVAQQLLKHASSWAINRGAKHVEYRYASDTHFDLPHKSDKVSFYLSLPETSEALRQSFKSKLRSQIKKAQSYPHQVRHGGAELVDDFYRVFSENMRDLGTPVYDKQLFRNLAITLGNRLSVTVIYYDNNPAAAAILIGHKHRLEIPWASTLRTHNPKSVNMLLYWEVLQWAIQKNYRVFDFGRCSTDAGTYKFKAQWGATELPLHWDYQLFNGEMPALNTKNIKYKFLISVWKRLPVFVANTLGPHVVKYLP